MKDIEQYFEQKRKERTDKMVFLGFVVMIVASVITLIIHG